MATTLEVDPETRSQPAAEQPPPKKSRRPLIIAAVVAVVAVAFGLREYLYSRNHTGTDNAQVDGHITPIAPRVQAFVARVLVDDNQPVQAGDTLVILDDRDVRARLQQAQADYAAALSQSGSRGAAGQAQAQLAAARSSASSADAGVAAAEAAWRKAAADLERYRRLAARNIVPPQQLDAAQAGFDAAAANLEAARRQASAAESQVGAAMAALRGADARLAAAQAAVETAQLQLGYTVITAPEAGVVAKRNVEPGELVQVGQSLMSLVPLSDVWVSANLKETQLRDVDPGDPVEFSVDAYPGRKFHGEVQSLSPATGARFALLPPDNATGNFTKVVQRVPVKIAVTDPDPAWPLRPGMSVNVTITTH